MKKHIFFLVLFLGSFVTYSQVGIGTPMPNSSSQLEIVASNRGVLIPRVSLVSSTDTSTIASGNVNSLLVFNTAVIADIKPGYYYWFNNKWNRIITDSETSVTPGTVIYNSNTTEFSYVDPSGNLQPIDFRVIVKANETITTQTQDLTTGAITYTNEAGTASTSQVVSANANNLLLVGTDGGAMLSPSAIARTISVSNASNANISTITVDGITSSGSPIINTNETSLSGTSLTTTVNGVASSALDLAPILSAGTTNTLSLAGNTLTSTVNGVVSAADAVSGVSNASNINTSTVTVNGITSIGAPIVNTNETSLSGTNLTTTVNGVASSALDLAPILSAGTTNTLSLAGNTLTSTVNGVVSASDAVSGVSNASNINTSTVTVNGIMSTGAPIVNTNETSLSGTSLTTTVNGVASANLDLTPAITAATTNTLSLAGNTLTSTVNGVISASDAVSGVSNASNINTSTVTVNGITSTGAPIVNTNETSLSGTNLTTTVNGVASTALDLTPAMAAGTTVSNTSSVNSLSTTVNGVTGVPVNIVNSNTLTAANGNLVSTINGVASTPAVSVLVSADNGLTVLNGNVQLGGTLTAPTSIVTNAANTLAISGLQPSISGTDFIVAADGAGVLKTLPSSVLNNWQLTGNAGTTASTAAGANFVGTTDLKALNFRVNNIHTGWLGYQTAGIGTSSVYFGANAGFSGAAITNGAYGNIGIGDNALAANTSNAKVAIGALALQNNTTGFNNAAFGYLTLQNNLTGQDNTAIGVGALQNNTGSTNVAIGSNAGTNNTVGTANSFLGPSADLTSSGLNVSNATAIGNNAKVGASNSIVLGGTGLNAVKVGIGNTIPSNTLHITSTTDPIRAEGLQAGNAATDNFVVATSTGILRTVTASNANFWRLTGNGGTDPTVNFVGTTDNNQLNFKVNNVPAGKIGLPGTGTFYANTYFGYNAGTADAGTTLPSTTTAFGNVAFGNNALTAITTGSSNSAFGTNALPVNTTGFGNTAIGPNTLTKNTIGFNNIAIGNTALLNTNATDGNNGSNNVGIGFSTLRSNTTGFRNIAIGVSSLYGNTTGSYNVCIGGTGSTDVNATNTYGTFLGYDAAAGINATTDAMALGHAAKTSANYGIAIGSNSFVQIGATNSVVIGRNANTAALNAIILGAEVGNTSAIPAPLVGIGTNAPLNSLHVKTVTNSDPVRFEGLMNGVATNNVVVADAAGVLKIISPSLLALEPWQTQSTTAKATSNTDAIYQMGKVGIGTANLLGTIDPTVWLAVNGSIQTATATYPDYVFENYFNKTNSSNEKYAFKSLKEIEKFVNENRHLPGVTGIAELTKNEKGDYIFNATKLSVQVLEKVEELYLHVIEQQKELEAKDKEIQNLKQKSAEMDLRLERLEKLLGQTSSNKG